MGLSLNPFELYKYWKEVRRNDKESFVAWLNRVQEHLRAFLTIWTKIQSHVGPASASSAFSALEQEWLSKMVDMEFEQLRVNEYIDHFYQSTSLVAFERLSPSKFQTFTEFMSQVLATRNIARNELNKIVDNKQKRLFVPCEEMNNDEASIGLFRKSIKDLQEEIVILDVFIETVKANPKAFK